MTRGPASDAIRALTRKLTTRDIDRRIGEVVRALAASAEPVGGDPEGDGSRPRRITAADVVARVRPFLSSN